MSSSDASDAHHTVTAFQAQGRPLDIVVVLWSAEVIKVFRKGRHESTYMCLHEGSATAMVDHTVMRRFKSNSRAWVRAFNTANPRFYALPYREQMDVLYALAPEVHGQEVLNLHNEDYLRAAMRAEADDDVVARATAQEQAEDATYLATTAKELEDAYTRVRDASENKGAEENPTFFDIDAHIAAARERRGKEPEKERKPRRERTRIVEDGGGAAFSVPPSSVPAPTVVVAADNGERGFSTLTVVAALGAAFVAYQALS